jgi:nicotinamide riboside kinase
VRIYFVGSHATGKTTLCRYVSRRYGLPMISEVARAVLAEMETSLDALRTDMELVEEYQERVFERQIAVEKMHQGRFVSDRAFDNLAYVAEHTTRAAAMMNDQRFHDYMAWVREGVVFFLRPHPSLLKDDGVRAGVSWDSVLRIDGMVKLMLEQHRISYLPIESVSMQERVRAVEFVLSRCGVEVPATARDASVRQRTQSTAGASITELPRANAAFAANKLVREPTLESWPYALVESADHEA